MIRKDYILRLIEEYMAVLSKILRLRNSSQFYQAHLTLTIFVRKIFPDYDALPSASNDELTRHCSYNGAFDPELCLLLAKLATEEATLLKCMNNPGLAHERAILALRCMDDVMNSGYDCSNSIDDTVVTIIEALHPQQCTNEQLLCVFDIAHRSERHDILFDLYYQINDLTAASIDEIISWGIRLLDSDVL